MVNKVGSLLGRSGVSYIGRSETLAVQDSGGDRREVYVQGVILFLC